MADRSLYVKAWKAANPERMAEYKKRRAAKEHIYNANRRAKYAAEHPRPVIECGWCGFDFEGRPDQKYCSQGCRDRAHYHLGGWKRRRLRFLSQSRELNLEALKALEIGTFQE